MSADIGSCPECTEGRIIRDARLTLPDHVKCTKCTYTGFRAK